MDSSASKTWQVGEVIENLYQVRQLFEGGGMGLVYRVYHVGWNVDLAMKCPRKEVIERSGLKNFEHECELWIQLGLHPHIATCHYVRQIDRLPCIFAEFVEGGSLREWILTRKLYRGGEDVALARIVDAAIQFAWGLDFAHSHGLVHQDVKPGNVLMTPDGSLKVTDFGLAGFLKGSSTSNQGMTPAYGSPEQTAKKQLTLQTDIWSWAVSILEMFTGGLFWKSCDEAKAMLEHFRARGLQARSLPPMPRPLYDLLRHCFRSKPENRPCNFREIVVCLTDIYAEVHNEPYWREPPDTDFFAGDALNNRAVSLIDLGRTAEAGELFEQALSADPLHPEATFNRGMIRFRAGQMSESDLLTQLQLTAEADHANWIPPSLIARVFLECGRPESALCALETARNLAVEDGDLAVIEKLEQEAKTPKLKHWLLGIPRQIFALSFPRCGAEHSHNAAKMKRLLQKARDAHREHRAEDVARYLERLCEIPGFARHPEVQRFLKAFYSV